MSGARGAKVCCPIAGAWAMPISEDKQRLFEAQLRLNGSVTLTKDNADDFLAARALTVRPHPSRADLVLLERSTIARATPPSADI